ncbi:hypothetical protein EDEG_03933 [Edhazardia aedis USNM 41457]|uniref:Uncharacterized protein n=1 Tax=Edhazardia aedis (strain USNM 41457) TaxID=1003232 RepID=J9D0T4_EDHAE|nr:hypothetical protein EDEG_03933 [Edhazardia aedis USNM 41457]|eukprot:EJW01481.1 hypothetical protein EDEG_03933 [Edhazardia aedis USNM 41457]
MPVNIVENKELEDFCYSKNIEPVKIYRTNEVETNLPYHDKNNCKALYSHNLNHKNEILAMIAAVSLLTSTTYESFLLLYLFLIGKKFSESELLLTFIISCVLCVLFVIFISILSCYLFKRKIAGLTRNIKITILIMINAVAIFSIKSCFLAIMLANISIDNNKSP